MTIVCVFLYFCFGMCLYFCSCSFSSISFVSLFYLLHYVRNKLYKNNWPQ